MSAGLKLPVKSPDLFAFILGFLPLVAWFLYQTHFYATHVRTGLPPDELHHLNVALFYRDAPGIFLTASEQTYPYGPIDYHPYLYHLLLGKLLLLNVFQVRDELLLRYASIACAVGTLFALWALLRELKVSWPGKLAAIAAITNITMFVYISSAVTYDNFINLMAILMQLYFIRTLRDPSWSNALVFLSCLLAGTLAKVTFLPFYIVLLLIAALFHRQVIRTVKTIFAQQLRVRDAALALLAATLLIGNIYLYVGNYLKFRAIIPAFDQVVGEEAAVSNYPQARRDKILIQSKNSRADMSFSEFVPKYFESALWSIYGIMGHKHFYREQIEMDRFYLTAIPTVVGALVFLACFLLGKEHSPPDARQAVLLAFLFAFFYISIVMLDNFNSFKTVRVFGYSLQGRYLFPVLGSVLAVCAFFSFYRIRRAWLAFLLATVLSFVYLKQGMWSIISRMQEIGFF